MSTTLSFDPGNVDVSASDFGLWPFQTLSFNVGAVAVTSFGFDFSFLNDTGENDVKVSSPTIRFRRIRTLKFNSGNIDITQFGLRFTPRARTSFVDANVLVSAPGFRTRPAIIKLQFSSADILVTGAEFTLLRLVSRLLPEIRPTGREFTPPSHAINSVYTESKIQVRRLKASRKGLARLKLIYENLYDSEVLDFIQVWDEARGSYLNVKLPEVVLDSASEPLRVFMASPEIENEWVIDKVPTISTRQTGASDLTLELVSRHNPRLNRLSNILLPDCTIVEDESGAVTCDVIEPPDCSLVDQSGC